MRQGQELNERNSNRKRGTNRLASTVTETNKDKNERKEVEMTTQGHRQYDGDKNRQGDKVSQAGLVRKVLER